MENQSSPDAGDLDRGGRIGAIVSVFALAAFGALGFAAREVSRDQDAAIGTVGYCEQRDSRNNASASAASQPAKQCGLTPFFLH